MARRSKNMFREDRPSRLWRTAAILAALAAAIALGFALYKNQAIKEEKIVQEDIPHGGISGKPIRPLTEATKKELAELLKLGNVLAVSVVEARLAKNERETIFFQGRTTEVQAAWDAYASSGGARPPLFSSNPKQNDRIANLLNGNLDCRLFNTTVGYQFYPDVDKFAPWICSISIPPGFDGSGDFNGFISIHLAKEPTDEDKKRLAEHVSKASANLYKREVDDLPKE